MDCSSSSPGWSDFTRNAGLLQAGDGSLRGHVREDLIGQQVQAGPAFVDRQPPDEWVNDDFPSAALDLVNQLLGGEDLNGVEAPQIFDRGGGNLVGPRYVGALPGAVFDGFVHDEITVTGLRRGRRAAR